MDTEISMWVVYEHPRDYPDSFVVRRHDVVRGSTPRPTEEYHVAASLVEARQHVPPGLYRQSRYEDDDQNIVEVWF